MLTSGATQRSCQWLKICHCWAPDSLRDYQTVEREEWRGESEWQARQSRHSDFDDASEQWSSASQQFVPNCASGRWGGGGGGGVVCVCVCV